MSASDISEIGPGLAGLLLLGAGAASGGGAIALAVGAAWALRQAANFAAGGRRRPGARPDLERQRKLEEDQRRLAGQAWARAHQALQDDIDALGNAPEREALSISLMGMESSFRDAAGRGDSAFLEEAVNGLRERILSARMEEVLAASQKGPEEQASPSPVSPATGRDRPDEDAALVADICGFGGRVAFFDEGEAEAIGPLLAEAREGAGGARLRMIRDQVRTTYGRLKERAVLTDLFKRDLRDFLPLVRRARGESAERLCARMEDLLEAPAITREEYNDVYRAVKAVMMDQLEAIEDAILAEKVGAVLGEIGYTLLDEEGAELTSGAMRTLAAPYDGYRVRVKVSGEGQIATRLVRVVGTEEEKAHVSEYQRQKDIEAGRKWCKDLDRFYGALAEQGLKMETVLRREPGEEELTVMVDPSVRRPRAAAQQQGQEQLRERQM